MKTGEERKLVKTYLDEGDVLCDKCGKLSKREDAIEIRDPLSTVIIHQHKGKCPK